MEQLYFVKVNDTKEEIIKEQGQDLLTRALGISEEAVAKLLERVPGAITKPIQKSQAKQIAENFAKAGISTTVVVFSKAKASSIVRPKANTPSQKSQINTVSSTAVKAKPKATVASKIEEPKPSNSVATTAEDKSKELSVKEIKLDEPSKADASIESLETSEASVKDSSISTLDSADLYRPILRTRLWRKIFSISSTTALLLFFANLVIFWFAIRPIVQEQIIMARLEPSLVSSASLSDSVTVRNNSLIVSPQLLTQLVKTIDTKSIDFLVISDLKAKTVTNWHPNFAISNNLEQEISKQAQFAVKGNTGIYKQTDSNGFIQKILNPNTVSIAYQPLLKNSQVVGATIIGISNQAINNLLNRILLLWLVISLIPLVLSYIISAFRSRGIAKNIIELGRTADEISRGNLNNEIEAQTNDELQYISNALERLRVSMSEALIRLRRRR